MLSIKYGTFSFLKGDLVCIDRERGPIPFHCFRISRTPEVTLDLLVVEPRSRALCIIECEAMKHKKTTYTFISFDTRECRNQKENMLQLAILYPNAQFPGQNKLEAEKIMGQQSTSVFYNNAHPLRECVGIIMAKHSQPFL